MATGEAKDLEKAPGAVDGAAGAPKGTEPQVV